MTAGGSTAAPSAVHLVHRTAQRADEVFARMAPGLSPRQFEVLKAVSLADGMSQTEIMSATGIDRSSTATLVARLVREGLLHRRRTRHDQRAYAVKLTPKGRQTLEKHAPLARAADDALLSGLASPERLQFLQALKRILVEAQ